MQSRFFVTSDGVRLHYLEAGPRAGHTIVFVPGWTMPAWIWGPQIQAFAQRYHVVAFDPRGQGESDVPPSGYEPGRRGQDIAELIAKLAPVPVAAGGLVAGRARHARLCRARTATEGGRAGAGGQFGRRGAAAAVPSRRATPRPCCRTTCAMHRFVPGMFHHPQSEAIWTG